MLEVCRRLTASIWQCTTASSSHKLRAKIRKVIVQKHIVPHRFYVLKIIEPVFCDTIQQTDFLHGSFHIQSIFDSLTYFTVNLKDPQHRKEPYQDHYCSSVRAFS